MKTVYSLAILALLSASSALPEGPADEAAVLEATLRQQIVEHLDATDRARHTVICLGINPGEAPQSPSTEFMARFRGDTAVRRLTECEPKATGALEGTTSRPAVIVTAGPVDWRSAREAWVTVTYFRSATQSALRRYRVVRERDGWVSLGQIVLDAPA